MNRRMKCMASIGAVMLIVSVAPHDGFAQTPPEAEPITITVEIVAADVTQNQIQVRLEPAGAAGTLTLELRDPDTHVILDAQARTGSAEIQNETFDLDNWTNDAIGEYQTVNVTWNVNGVSVSHEFAYHIRVLGIYKQTQYNTPNETGCSGDQTNFAYTDGPGFNCTTVLCSKAYWHQSSAVSGWVNDVFYTSGSGYSTNLGYVTREWQCKHSECPSNLSCTYRFRRISQPCAKCSGVTLIPNQSVAINPNHPYLKCGDHLYVHGMGRQIVHDVGDPEKVIEQQLDHYV